MVRLPSGRAAGSDTAMSVRASGPVGQKVTVWSRSSQHKFALFTGGLLIEVKNKKLPVSPSNRAVSGPTVWSNESQVVVDGTKRSVLNTPQDIGWLLLKHGIMPGKPTRHPPVDWKGRPLGKRPFKAVFELDDGSELIVSVPRQHPIYTKITDIVASNF